MNKWLYYRGGNTRRRASELPHGDVSASTYTNWHCRCDECRAANAARQVENRARRASGLAKDDPRHGTFSTYTNYECRCAKCREADRLHKAEWTASQ